MSGLRRVWRRFAQRRPGVAQFLVFFVLSNAVTVLQLVLMPLLKAIFSQTSLIDTDFQVLPIGRNVDGSQYFVFDYAAGALPAGGGGLAYFLAVQLAILAAQIVNFFAQRSVTFKSNSSIARAAFWYAIAYVIITFAAAAAQGLYKAPIYAFFIERLGWGTAGGTIADVITMTINAAISFWVFYPIFRVIFKRVPDAESADQVMGEAARPTA